MALRGVVAPLRHVDFRRVWSAQAVSIVGDKVNQVALTILVYRMTGSLTQMGFVFAITFLPAALFGLVAGPFVDRWDRRRTMIVADVVRAVLVASIPLAAMGRQLWPVYLLAFAVATVSLFFEPARFALVPQLVGAEELVTANSLDSSTSAIAELLGIAFGGALVAFLDVPKAFYVDAATYLISAAFVASVAHRAIRPVARKLGLLTLGRELKDGISRIVRDPVLSGVVVSFGIAAIGGAATITLTVLLALYAYAGYPLSDALRLTTLDLATTVGLLVGSVLVGMSGAGLMGRKYLGGLVGFGLLFALLFFVKDLRVAAGVMLLAGVANMWFQIPVVTILQSYTEDETRGRVLAVRTTIVRVATVIGLASAGFAAQRFGLEPLVAVVGLFVCGVGLVGFAFPRLREA